VTFHLSVFCASRHFLTKFGPRTAAAEASWTHPPPFSLSHVSAALQGSPEKGHTLLPCLLGPRIAQDAGSQQRIVLISTYRWRRCVTPVPPQSSATVVHPDSRVLQMTALYPEVGDPREDNPDARFLTSASAFEYRHRTRLQADAHTTRVPSYPMGRHRRRTPHLLAHLPQNVFAQGRSGTWVC